MDLDAVLTAIETHAQAVGQGLDDPMTDVCVGLPWPRGRCGRILWGGDVIPAPRMPGRYTLSTEIVGDEVIARFFWPVPSADEAGQRKRVLEMAAVADGLREAVNGDNSLGGEVECVEVGATVVDLVVFGEVPYVQMDVPMQFGHREKAIA